MTEADYEALAKDEPDVEPPASSAFPVTPSYKRRGRWASAFFSATVLFTLLGLHQYGGISLNDDQIQACPSPEAMFIKAPRPNLWNNLDVKEAVELRKWLMDPERGLNLTDSLIAKDSDNFIHVIENYPPPKKVALAFLSDTATKVDRYAHAIINHGPNETIVDYLVGPLPPTERTTIRPLTEIYHAPVPLNARTTFNYPVLNEIMTRFLGPTDDIIRDLFNISALDGSLTVSAQMPMSYDGEWRRSWVQVKRQIPGSWIQPVDFYYLADMTGTDPSQYHIAAYVHGGKMYRSEEDLRKAWNRGLLHRVEYWDTSDWATRSIKGKERDLDERAGPRSVQLDGARYRVDRDESYVTWMGWAFYLSFERDMGLHLWDIHFRDERIIYELAPQEAMAQYSGSDPHQASTVWLDRAFGMGGNVREVILGYDCPDHSHLSDATIHEMGSSERRNAICIFERESGRPLSRHTGKGKDEMGAVKGYELVVRSISTVGNYDYIFDYTFQLDGTIEIRLSASGYLQGGVWDHEQSPYGHMLRPGIMGSLHDHIINYKIDFDLVDTQNSFTEVTLAQETLNMPWFAEDGWGPVTQTRIERQIINEESLFNWPQNQEGTYIVTNEAKHNSWGNAKGYMLHPGPLCRLTNIDAKRTENSVNWAKHHLGVTRQYDDEPSSSSMWNGNLPGAPPVNFYKFFNNESIIQEDLVVWVNLGTHHIPRAEDSPNTLTNVATSYILLSPWNFNDYDVAMESQNSVLLNNEGQWEIVEPVKQPHCAASPPEPLVYHGLSLWKEDGTPYTSIETSAFRSHAEAIHAFGL